MNRVVLIGRLTREPEMRTTLNGSSVTKFNLAVTRTYQNQDGERDADFINCIAWKKQAENIAKYCSKGSQVAVEGRIQTGSYDDQNGTKRYTTDIICENVTFLDKKNKEEVVEDNVTDKEEKEDPFANFGEEVEIKDEDLPF